MFLVGCSNQENNVTGPTTNDTQFSKVTLSDPLPIQFATTIKAIDGSIGGKITMVQNVLSSEGRIVQVNSEFEVTAGAFVGIQNITMTVDADNGCVSFSPHMNFSQTCFLNFGLQNMNLANLGFVKGDKKAEFVYFNDYGTIDPVANMGVNVIYGKGNIQVQKGRINHFSRYGFVRKDG
jgi:hypothetical protein